MKKRKKKKLRDKFTDALGEEIAARENLNIEKLEQKNKASKVDLNKKIKPKQKNPPKVEVKPAPKVDEVEEEIPPPLIPIIPEKVEVPKKVESDFDKRVATEAKNNFLNEKPRRNRKMTADGRPAPERPTFRAKMMRERIAEVAEEKHDKNKKIFDKDAEISKGLTRAETAGAVLSAVMLVYAFSTLDKPLFFMALSLFSHTMRPFIGSLCGKYNRDVQNAMRGFSIVLFFGAIILLFV